MATRTYAPTTREALFLLSRGNCYAPGCKRRVMEKNGDQWIALAEVAHIHGLNKDSRRFDESIPVPQRNSFKNLLLLCEKHHKLVDGARTWMNYPETTLKKWKEDREGELSDELGQVDWITEDNLRDVMAHAIEDTERLILDAIDGITAVSGETLAVLKTLVAETLKLPYLSPDDIASLGRSADVLQSVFPDYVPQLARSAVILQEVTDYVELLSSASRNLVNLADYADMLHYATDPLINLGTLIPQLQSLSESLGSSSVYQYRAVVKEMRDTADRITGSARALSRAAPLPPATRPRNEPVAPVRAFRTPSRQRSWSTFWWGFTTCMAFVIVVLCLWAYTTAHGHK
jgi:hypothetical protein